MQTDTRPLLLLAGMALLLMLIGSQGSFERIDRITLDALLTLDAKTRPLPNDIVVIDIDQKSLEDMNDIAGRWPWPRIVHAELLAQLAQLAPKAIVFDLLFNEYDTIQPDFDALFAETVAANDNVYLPTLLLSNGTGAALADFPATLHIEKTAAADPNARAPLLVPLIVPPSSWRGGTINFIADDDGIGRRHYLFQQLAGWKIPSLPQRLAADLGWQMPASDDITLRWYREPLPQQHSYADVFTDLSNSHSLLAAQLRGKIILIGASAPGLGDFRPTPMRSTHAGIAILATVIGNLQAGDWLTETRWGLGLYPLLLLLLLPVFQRKISPLHIGASLAGITLLLLALELLLLKNMRIIVHTMAPMLTAWLLFLALALTAWWQTRQQREAAVSLFGRFLDRRIVQQLLDGGTIADARTTQAREISILFSDIRGFTTLSERSTPEQVVTLLNDYFSRQVDVVFRTQGTLDKFIGDAIMAFWGAPADDAQHAIHAVEAALTMVDVLVQFKTDLGAPGEHFDVGIGVHTGPAVVGFIGSHDRLDYTAIGDSVNLASRIESSTKGIARILVSEFTAQACGDAFDFIDHGVVHVKGREQGVRLYEPRRKMDGHCIAARQ